jgi:nicotinate-nucleotide adenylyltransferase
VSRTGKRIGLLTGTFDPVHLGHVAMAQAAMEGCELDQVWFLVNPAPGHKSGVANLSDRLAMVRLAIADDLRLELREPIFHRMAEFERLMSGYLQDEFEFVIGADVLADMTEWEDYQAALERGTFVVARRVGAPAVPIDPRLKVQTFPMGEHAGASSRLIKEQLAAGVRPSELDDRVYAYILDHGLYHPAR